MLDLLLLIASRGLTSSKLDPVYLSQLYIQIEVKCDLSHPPTFVWHWCEPYLHLCICGGVQRLNTSPLPPVLALSLTQKHALSLGQLSQWWSYRADGKGRCTLSITEVISIPLRDWKKLCVREMEGPRKETPLDGGTLRSIYNKLPASAFPMRHAQTPLGVRVCASVYLLLSVWACMYK